MYDPELMQASLTNVIEKHKTRGQTQEQFEVSEDSSWLQWRESEILLY